MPERRLALRQAREQSADDVSAAPAGHYGYQGDLHFRTSSYLEIN